MTAIFWFAIVPCLTMLGHFDVRKYVISDRYQRWISMVSKSRYKLVFFQTSRGEDI